MRENQFFIFVMGLLFLWTFVFLFSCNSEAVNLDKHPIYAQIIKNHPTINKKYAFNLSNIIYRKAKKYDINAHILTAIFAQESMYKVSAKNCTTGIRKLTDKEVLFNLINCSKNYKKLGHKNYSNCAFNIPKIKNDKVCTDFGIGQIWYKTAERYNFDIDRLITDVVYSVEASAIVLKDIKKTHGDEKNWWSRYNSSSRHKRKYYKMLVDRYL